MRQNLTAEELVEHFTLTPSDLALLGNKSGAGRLGFAVLLKVFERDLRFPDELGEVPAAVVAHVAKQIGADEESYWSYDLRSRNATYRRTQIREALGVRDPRANDAKAIATWLAAQIVGDDVNLTAAMATVYERFRTLKVVPPTAERIERIAWSALSTAEQRHFATLTGKLSVANKTALDALLVTKADTLSLTELKADAGRAGLESLLHEIAKLKRLTDVVLPADFFVGVSRKFLGRQKQRVAAESIHETARHPDRVRHALVASFCYLAGC
jgi:hypothetical protein